MFEAESLYSTAQRTIQFVQWRQSLKNTARRQGKAIAGRPPPKVSLTQSSTNTF